MIYRCLIFMLCCSLAVADVTGLVGGSAADSGNACFFDPDQRTIADAVEANGAYKYTKADCVVVDNTNIQIQVTEGQGSASWVGLWVAITSSDGTSFDGLHEILSVDTGANPDNFNIDETWTDQTNCDIVIGGAVPIVDVAGHDLQDILDHATSSAAAQNVDIYVAGSDTATATIVADAGGGAATGTLKRVIGANTSYVADGTHATITANYDTFPTGTPVIQVDDISYIQFENIHVIMTGAETTAGEDCFQIANADAQAVINFYNCKATGGYRGFNFEGGAANRLSLYEMADCTSTGSIVEGMRLTGNYYRLDRCYVEASSPYAIYSTYTQGVLTNCIIDGGGTGLWYNSTGAWANVINCSFYNQTVSCIGAAGTRDVGLTAYNNLFFVNAAGTPEPILDTAGVIFMLYEDYNFTNAEAAQSTMLTGANSASALWSDTETNLWTDAANNVFSVVDAAMIDGGKPTLSDEGGTPADGYTTPGAAQLAQTQTGGGGQPIIGGSVVK